MRDCLGRRRVDPEHRNAMAAAGGIVRVVEAMSGHMGNADVQQAGCSALNAMAVHQDGALNAWAWGREEHMDVDEAEILRVCACGAGNYLMEMSKMIAALGGVERVLAAMKGHPGCEGVQSLGCRVLGKLAIGNEGECQPRGCATTLVRS